MTFSFAISPTTTTGVDTDESSRLARGFRVRILELIDKWDFTSPIAGLTIFPQIMDPDVGQFSDLLKYRRKEKAIFVGVNIPFKQWVHSSASERIDILADNFLASISRIPEKYLSDRDRDMFRAAIEHARSRMKTTALN